MSDNYRPVFGYYNGEPCYTRDEYIFAKRKFGPIESDEELIAFAEKVTYGWYWAGWKHSFTSYFLSTRDEPYDSLTLKEFARLQELQKEAREELKRIEEAKQWRSIGTFGYADNSVEEVYEDKDGNRKVEMVVYPHGDPC